MPHVAREEDARLARFEEVGVAVEPPPISSSGLEQVAPGEQEPMLVAQQPTLCACRRGLAADENEQCVGARFVLFTADGVREPDPLELAVTEHARDTRVRPYVDLRVDLAAFDG